MRRVITFLVILISFNGWAQNPLPSINIKDFSGKELIFNSIVAKGDTATVVDFWATWCIPCITELDNINDLLPGLKKEIKANFVAISVDDARTSAMVKPFVKGKGWNFVFYSDVNSQLKRALNINDIPYVLIIKNGRIVYQHTGYVSGDEEELLAQLKSL